MAEDKPTVGVVGTVGPEKRGETGPVQRGTMRRGTMQETQPRTVRQSRRRFVQTATGIGLAVAGGSLLAGRANQVAPFFSRPTDGQLETTRIRVSQIAGICIAPQYVAEDQLRAEGFTDVEYVQT